MKRLLKLNPGRSALIGFGIFSLVVTLQSPAFAYGTEGLFGGRPNPDNTITINNPVQLEARPGRAESVLQHPRPDYDPGPYTVGSFYLYPSLETGVSYNSNIFATSANQTADGIFTIHPTLNAISNWNRHALSLTTAGDLNFFKDNDTENFNNAIFQLNGRYDILNQTWLGLRGGYQYLAEPRSSPNTAAGREPTTFNVYNAGMTAYRGAGILRAQMDYDFHKYNYNNTPARVGGGTINQTFRNRDEHVGGAKLTYAVTENFKPYVRGQYNIRNYTNDLQRRSSDGYRASAGALWDFGGITSLDVYAGWLSQDYSKFGGAKKVNNGFDMGGRFTWNVTGLTSVVFEANRSIEETTIAAFNSFKATGGSATVTHELLRNLLLEGRAAFTRDDFQGNGVRQDDIKTAGAGARWLIDRNLYSDLTYDWSHRTSTAAGAGYITHLATLRVGVQF